MIFCGVDPSKNHPGAGMVDERGHIIWSGHAKSVDDLIVQIVEIAPVIECLAVEKPYRGKRGTDKMSASDAEALGYAAGTIAGVLKETVLCDLDVYRPAPSEWRSVTGTKKEGKENFKQAAKRRCFEIWGVKGLTDDQAEGCLIALACLKKWESSHAL